MAFTQKFYNLKGVELTLNSGIVLDCTNFNIARKVQVIDRTSGASLREQRVINKEMAPDVSIEGFNTSNLAFGNLKPGTKITAFAVDPTAGGDNATFLQSDFFTVWPLTEMYIGDTDTSLSEGDASKWKTQILCGIIGSNLPTT